VADQVVIQDDDVLPRNVCLLLSRIDARLHVQSLDPHLRGDDLRTGGGVRSQVVKNGHEITVELVLLRQAYVLPVHGHRLLRQEHVPLRRGEEERVLLVDYLLSRPVDDELATVDQLPRLRWCHRLWWWCLWSWCDQTEEEDRPDHR